MGCTQSGLQVADGNQAGGGGASGGGGGPPPQSKPSIFEKPGCYLKFYPEDHGRFELVWSKTFVEGASIYARQMNKPVPEHKFKTNGGRQVLARKIQADRVGYHRSICEFVREAKKAGCELYVIDDSSVPIAFRVHLHRRNNYILYVQPCNFQSLDDYDGVVSLNKQTTSLQVKQMTFSMFMEKGNLEGAGCEM